MIKIPESKANKKWRLYRRGWFSESNSWNDCFYDNCYFLDKIRNWLDSNGDTGPGTEIMHPLNQKSPWIFCLSYPFMQCYQAFHDYFNP